MSPPASITYHCVCVCGIHFEDGRVGIGVSLDVLSVRLAMEARRIVIPHHIHFHLCLLTTRLRVFTLVFCHYGEVLCEESNE